MIDDIIQDAKSRMAKSVETLRHELTKLRTGRAHTSLLDHITVDYYGSEVPLKQVANVNVEDARTLIVTPWEKPMVAVIEKAIMKSDLGLNPNTAGTVMRIPLPPLTEERRRDMVKRAKNEAENARISIRNIRRIANETAKKLKKDGVPEDEIDKLEADIQKITDDFIAKVDKILELKDKDIMTV